MTATNWVDDAEKALEERELGWDDEIEKESEFILLPEGDYDYVVDSFERGRFEGSEKMPPCNKAILTLKIAYQGQTATVKHNLLLHTKTEWMLSEFFKSIGQKKKGEPLKMNWGLVPGSKGRCNIEQYTGKNGNTYHQVKRFLEPVEVEQVTFKPGEF